MVLIVEHGITGDVLAMMDHASLQDLGIASVGHRLNLLRSVWELKQEQGLELGEDDWRPQGRCTVQSLVYILTEDVEEAAQKQTTANVDRLWALIQEQRESIELRHCM